MPEKPKDGLTGSEDYERLRRDYELARLMVEGVVFAGEYARGTWTLRELVGDVTIKLRHVREALERAGYGEDPHKIKWPSEGVADLAHQRDRYREMANDRTEERNTIERAADQQRGRVAFLEDELAKERRNTDPLRRSLEEHILRWQRDVDALRAQVQSWEEECGRLRANARGPQNEEELEQWVSRVLGITGDDGSGYARGHLRDLLRTLLPTNPDSTPAPEGA